LPNAIGNLSDLEVLEIGSSMLDCELRNLKDIKSKSKGCSFTDHLISRVLI
jgi:hypothetical protein